MIEGKASKSQVTLRKGRVSIRADRLGGAWASMTTTNVPTLATQLDEVDHMIDIAVGVAKGERRMKRVIVVEGDTDVIVSVLTMDPVGVQLGIMTSTGSKGERIVDVSSVQTKLRGEFPDSMQAHVLNALIGFHVFTGSDFTSQFDGVTKSTAWKLLREYCAKNETIGATFLQALANVGAPANCN